MEVKYILQLAVLGMIWLIHSDHSVCVFVCILARGRRCNYTETSEDILNGTNAAIYVILSRSHKAQTSQP